MSTFDEAIKNNNNNKKIETTTNSMNNKIHNQDDACSAVQYFHFYIVFDIQYLGFYIY